MQADINQQRGENKKMKLLTLNDEEYSLLQNILNNFVLHGVESIPNDDSCNVLKINDRINVLKDVEPVGYMESNGINYINLHGFTHINAEQSGSINIPLYKLD
ncbi:hypothetical protein JEP66_13100 [Proteus mirabilis]|uniref:hypothetical protein n=1 Tax=Proteus mirabilis TaxID=584 RepID=UPI001A236AF6|nr:hypothetical protein [Proteus mirabilis]MBI6242168.1 hypothetical protein [Proteus mirabilis]MCI9737495.1 hypothetical protein [Proteus mirabilis]MCI9750904.1 hypothetical protein [Proteus mirabilis]MCI9764625.1 hypothetical protein [Proteus mirabilis]MCI9780253.1 hypothetical protein [Proteus mirabilis]